MQWFDAAWRGNGCLTRPQSARIHCYSQLLRHDRKHQAYQRWGSQRKHSLSTHATRETLPTYDTEALETETAELSWDEIEERLDYARSLVTMLPLLRPIDDTLYNPAMEIWRRIASIPAQYRHLLVDRIDAGSIRVLWRYSMFRYIWDSEQTVEAFTDYSVLDDFPLEPGQVVEFKGKAEESILKARERLEEIEDDKFYSQGFSLSEESSQYKTHKFKQYFFFHPESGQLYGRTVLSNLLGIIPLGRVPYYSRVGVELTMTPVESDGGADITLVYDEDSSRDSRKSGSNDDSGNFGEGIGLYKEDLPHWWWPEPALGMTSPFGDARKDYVRVCGPGVYVGCSYPPNAVDLENENEFMYFMLVRKPLPGEMLGGSAGSQEWVGEE